MVTTAVGVFQGFTSTLTANLFAFVSDGESSQAFEALQGFEAVSPSHQMYFSSTQSKILSTWRCRPQKISRPKLKPWRTVLSHWYKV